MASEDQARVELRAAVLTDVGMVREHNEDSAHVDPQHNFFIVADGMGGHAAGEVASAMAVDKVRESLEEARSEMIAFSKMPDENRRKNLVKVLESAVRTAHESVYERGTRETDKQGMGTTLDVVLVAGHEAFVAHVGDSRTYLIREGKAAQITTDHTVAEVLVIEGKLSLEEAQISPLRTILVNAIGVAPEVGIEMAHVQLRQGDQLLLCSDGLHDYFPVEQELADHIDGTAPADALSALIDIAKERGGHDNITGIVVDVLSCEHKEDAVVTAGEITARLLAQDSVPIAIERDDTLPVERVTDISVREKKRRKKRKRKNKRKRARVLEAARKKEKGKGAEAAPEARPATTGASPATGAGAATSEQRDAQTLRKEGTPERPDAKTLRKEGTPERPDEDG